jgi:hypothetical protein
MITVHPHGVRLDHMFPVQENPDTTAHGLVKAGHSTSRVYKAGKP